MKTGCLLGHKWSVWYPGLNAKYDYRVCGRCKKQERIKRV